MSEILESSCRAVNKEINESKGYLMRIALSSRARGYLFNHNNGNVRDKISISDTQQEKYEKRN